MWKTVGVDSHWSTSYVYISKSHFAFLQAERLTRCRLRTDYYRVRTVSYVYVHIRQHGCRRCRRSTCSALNLMAHHFIAQCQVGDAQGSSTDAALSRGCQLVHDSIHWQICCIVVVDDGCEAIKFNSTYMYKCRSRQRCHFRIGDDDAIMPLPTRHDT